MTAGDGQQAHGPEQLSAFPEVALDWAYDDGDDPSRLTIFDPTTERIATSWITVDSDACLRLDRAR